MFIRALLAFIALPGFVAFVIPPLIAYADPWRGEMWLPGLVVMFVGISILLWSVRDFYVVGEGTLASWDPPQNLVMTGLYRYSRNPMYIGVLILVAGWALYLNSILLAAYTVLLGILFHLRIVMHEEPWLQSQFEDDWKDYKGQVSRWFTISGRGR